MKIDWFDRLAVQGNLKSLLQHHSSKATILRHSAFFIVQLSHSYMTTGKTIALIRWTFVGKVMSLLFNMLSRLVIASSKMQVSFSFMAAVTICSDFGAPPPQKKIKSVPVSQSLCHEVRGPDAMIFFFECCFKPALSLSSFTFIKRIFSSSLSDIRVVFRQSYLSKEGFPGPTSVKNASANTGDVRQASSIPRLPRWLNDKESTCQCVQSLGWDNPLKEEMATHSSFLAWEIPWTEEPGGLQSMGS